MTKNDEFINKLEIMLKANMVLWVTTHEEEKFIISLRKLVPKFQAPDYRVLIWSLSNGVLDYTAYLKKNDQDNYGQIRALMSQQTIDDPVLAGEKIKTKIPINTFETLLDFAQNQVDYPCLFVIKDISHVIDKKPERMRKLKDLIENIRTRSIGLIFLTYESNIPIALEKEIQQLDMPIPDRQEIANLLDLAMTGFSKLKVKLDKSQTLREKIIFNLLGLTEIEISQVLTYTCVKNTGITESSVDDIKNIKKQIIERSGALQFIATSDNIQIGGHDRFKAFVEERSLYLTKKFREYFNLKPPKGVCLVGPPGNGKSVLAKYIGYKWQLPLIRLDMGAVYGHLLGESENRLREALQIAEANAPCILWLDEIEKALGGTDNTDSGTTSRIFGKLLTWMAERNEMVFLYCTANNIDKIPPELLRAGRLDSVWWGDLPSKSDCLDIFKIHCNLNKIKLSDDDYLILAQNAFEKNMTGAEIEHVISESSFKAAIQSHLIQQEISVNRSIISNVLDDIRPYSVSNSEKLKQNRLKALNEFEFTSTEAKKIVTKLSLNENARKSEFKDD